MQRRLFWLPIVGLLLFLFAQAAAAGGRFGAVHRSAAAPAPTAQPTFGKHFFARKGMAAPATAQGAIGAQASPARRHFDHSPVRRHFDQSHFHHRHRRNVIILGTTLFPPLVDPFFFDPPVVYEAPPVEYIEAAPAPASPGVWYYCPEPKAYYPDVTECPGGWVSVPSVPPDGAYAPEE
jgi:hypothetical protein